MTKYIWLILIPLLTQLSACSPNNEDEAILTSLTYKHQPEIDSLYRKELYSDLRNYAFKNLLDLSHTDVVNRSYLYGAIGNTYLYSFHFDSAVYYFQKAYSLASKSKSIPLQANAGAGLLLIYTQSSIYRDQQDSLFRALNSMQEKAMPLNIKALLLDAMAEYSCTHDMRGMAQFFLSQSQEIYDKLIAGKALQYTDSLNLGSHYLYLYQSADFVENKTRKITYLRNARYWIGENKPRLGCYYAGMSKWCCYSTRNIDKALMYRDSLIQLGTATGLNFSDEIITIDFCFCDYYFFKAINYKLSQKYCDEMKKYFKSSVDPHLIISGKWMQADIDLKEARYRSSLSLLRSILPQMKSFNYAEKLRVAESIATCFDKMGMLDSAIIYYKQIAPLTVDEYYAQQKNIKQEADTKYLNKVKQSKIEEQHRYLQYSRSQRLWLLTGLGLTVLMIMLLYIIYRNKRKMAQKLDAQNTQLSSLNLQLKEANETKSKLFGIISHDLRSPISQLYQLMQLQLPESRIVLSLEEKEILEKQTHDATVSLLDGMEDLLIWSKSQLQSFNVNKTWTDLNDIYQRCHKLLQLQIRNKKLKMVNNIAINALLETDANFLLTIFRNLLNNAINASPAEGIITIDFQPLPTDKKQYCIIISNEGKSFSQEDYVNALSNAQTSHFLNGGLGLQVVNELSIKINMAVTFYASVSSGVRCIISVNSKVRIADNSC
jgi:signal transduction histidine kinase